MQCFRSTLISSRSVLQIALCGILIIASPVTMTDEDQMVARKLRAAGQILPLEQIYDAAKAVKPGQILETELEKDGNQYVYEVELLDKNGVVWEMVFDAKTAKLIELEQD